MSGVFVVIVEALPGIGSDDFMSYGGAYISVFTTDSTESDAIATANREISDAGWQFKSIDSVSLVTRSDYDDEHESLQYYEQALIDGIVLVIHTFPADPQQDDVFHQPHVF